MNTETGSLLNQKGIELFKQEFGERFAGEILIPVDENEMTKKQKENMQVSKHDNKSVLGKKFTSVRFKKRKFGRI